MGLVAAFGIAEEGEPSYEQFSYMYSITKSKSTDHGGWVHANFLQASERGHFVNVVPTSQKSWRNRRVLLSGDWESPSGQPVRFHIPTTFQIAGRSTCQSLLTECPFCTVTYARRTAEAKRMNESIKMRLMMGLQGKKKNRQLEAAPVPSAGADPKDQTLSDRLQQLNAESVPRGVAEAGSTLGCR
ncbi:unnamed protein product [Prunus armeniaca]